MRNKRESGCALLLGLCLLFGCSQKSATGPQKGKAKGGPGGAPVTVTLASQTNVPLQLSAIGHVVAFSIVAVRSRIEGTLQSVHFKEGDLVKTGDLIFTIDPRPLQ